MAFFVAFSKNIHLLRSMATFSPKIQSTNKLNGKMYPLKINEFTKKYPLSRGMIMYFCIWPISNLCQQAISGRKELNFMEAMRFCVYGSCFVAPTLYAWLRVATLMWPQQNLKSALCRAIVEQFTYTPFAMVCFFFLMTLMEGKTLSDAATEVGAKFIPTYQVGACVWPIVQTINHTLVPERNRVPFVGMCSLLWTCFLAYMKHLEAQKLAAKKLASKKLAAEQRAAKHSFAILVQ
ncbi:mpv17-like protein [Periplaneta americana]|uniref:mpv17-like protein n=1 Tax=Periplaneta americana TaxID=6978 RepID=UPI0037E8177C